MKRWRMRRSWRIWGAGLATGVAITGALALGYWYGVRSDGDEFRLPETLLRASATHGAETMAIATGPIDEGGEGLFILDYVTGELQCFVINPRGAGNFFARFRTNVVQTLGVEQGKKPSYVMVTGATDFIRGAQVPNRPASGVVYVCDTNTGNFAAWGIAWNRTVAAAQRPQQGPLVLLDVGKARNLEVIE